MPNYHELHRLDQLFGAVQKGCIVALCQYLLETSVPDVALRLAFCHSTYFKFKTRASRGLPVWWNILAASPVIQVLLANRAPSQLSLFIADTVACLFQHWWISRHRVVADKVNNWIDMIWRESSQLALCLMLFMLHVSPWLAFCNASTLFLIKTLVLHSPSAETWSNSIPNSVGQSFRSVSRGFTRLWRVICRKLVPRISQLIRRLENQALQRRKSEVQELHKYSYRKLTGPRQFRVLVVQPWKWSQLPKCRLEVVDFDHGSEYIACSYVWGSSDLSRIIIVDGSRLNITESAYCVIRKQQSFWAERRIWIDGVCINQHDPEEKASQVQVMNLIYAGAVWADAYLSLDDSEDTTLWELLNELFTLTAQQDSSKEGLVGLLLSDRLVLQWDTLAGLLTSPWFSRVWIIQEVVHAREVNLHFGNMAISWMTLKGVVTSISSYEFSTISCPWPYMNSGQMMKIGHPIAYDLIFRRDHLKINKAEPLFDIINSFSQSQASDSRDKLYAMLTLTCDKSSRDFPIDYQIAPETLFIRSMRHFLRHEGLHCLLGCTERHSSSRPANLPSWVIYWPDTGRVHHKLEIPSWRAASDISNAFQSTLLHTNGDRNVLRVETMLQFDDVDEAVEATVAEENSNTADDIESSRELHRWITEARELVLQHHRNHNPGDMAELKRAFYTTLTHEVRDPNDEGPLRWNKPGFASDYEFLEQYFNIGGSFEDSPAYRNALAAQEVLSRSTVGKIAPLQKKMLLASVATQKRLSNIIVDTTMAAENSEQYAEQQRSRNMISKLRNCQGRKIGVTAQGRVGSFPASVKAGDKICLIAGAPAPFVVRKVQSVSSEGVASRSIVGWCYLYGAMDGRLATGPWTPCDLI